MKEIRNKRMPAGMYLTRIKKIEIKKRKMGGTWINLQLKANQIEEEHSH